VSLLRQAKALGLSTSLDPGWDPAEQWGQDLFDALGALDILFLNEHEANAITGLPSADMALREMARRVPLALCKLGAGGAMMATGREARGPSGESRRHDGRRRLV
jgi:sugar/nucleoside kinase (ribokinase family)